MAPRHSKTPSIDLEKLAELRRFQSDGRGNPVKSLLKLFLRETPSLIQALEASLQKQESTRTFEQAEHLKTRCASLGAVRLLATADQIREAALTNHWENAQSLIPKLRTEFAQAAQILKDQPEFLPDPTRAA